MSLATKVQAYFVLLARFHPQKFKYREEQVQLACAIAELIEASPKADMRDPRMRATIARLMTEASSEQEPSSPSTAQKLQHGMVGASFNAPRESENTEVQTALKIYSFLDQTVNQVKELQIDNLLYNQFKIWDKLEQIRVEEDNWDDEEDYYFGAPDDYNNYQGKKRKSKKKKGKSKKSAAKSESLDYDDDEDLFGENQTQALDRINAISEEIKRISKEDYEMRLEVLETLEQNSWEKIVKTSEREQEVLAKRMAQEIVNKLHADPEFIRAYQEKDLLFTIDGEEKLDQLKQTAAKQTVTSKTKGKKAAKTATTDSVELVAPSKGKTAAHTANTAKTTNTDNTADTTTAENLNEATAKLQNLLSEQDTQTAQLMSDKLELKQVAQQANEIDLTQEQEQVEQAHSQAVVQDIKNPALRLAARAFLNHQARNIQQDLNTLVREAPTGTGKSLAYLIPVLFANQRVLVSTYMKSLQEQLMRDLPGIISLVQGISKTAKELEIRIQNKLEQLQKSKDPQQQAEYKRHVNDIDRGKRKIIADLAQGIVIKDPQDFDLRFLDLDWQLEHLDNIRYAVFKGQTNYFCPRNLTYLLDPTDQRVELIAGMYEHETRSTAKEITITSKSTKAIIPEERKVEFYKNTLNKLRSWYQEKCEARAQHTADFDNVPNDIRIREDQRPFLFLNRRECSMNSCDFKDTCPYLQAKEVVKQAQVAIVNHNTLYAQSEAEFLNENRQAIVVDEAHNLPHVLVNADTNHMRPDDMQNLLDELQKDILNHTFKFKATDFTNPTTDLHREAYGHLNDYLDSESIYATQQYLKEVEPLLPGIDYLPSMWYLGQFFRAAYVPIGQGRNEFNLFATQIEQEIGYLASQDYVTFCNNHSIWAKPEYSYLSPSTYAMFMLYHEHASISNKATLLTSLVALNTYLYATPEHKASILARAKQDLQNLALAGEEQLAQQELATTQGQDNLAEANVAVSNNTQVVSTVNSELESDNVVAANTSTLTSLNSSTNHTNPEETTNTSSKPLLHDNLEFVQRCTKHLYAVQQTQKMLRQQIRTTPLTLPQVKALQQELMQKVQFQTLEWVNPFGLAVNLERIPGFAAREHQKVIGYFENRVRQGKVRLTGVGVVNKTPSPNQTTANASASKKPQTTYKAGSFTSIFGNDEPELDKHGRIKAPETPSPAAKTSTTASLGQIIAQEQAQNEDIAAMEMTSDNELLGTECQYAYRPKSLPSLALASQGRQTLADIFYEPLNQWHLRKIAKQQSAYEQALSAWEQTFAIQELTALDNQAQETMKHLRTQLMGLITQEKVISEALKQVLNKQTAQEFAKLAQANESASNKQTKNDPQSDPASDHKDAPKADPKVASKDAFQSKLQTTPELESSVELFNTALTDKEQNSEAQAVSEVDQEQEKSAAAALAANVATLSKEELQQLLKQTTKQRQKIELQITDWRLQSEKHQLNLQQALEVKPLAPLALSDIAQPLNLKKEQLKGIEKLSGNYLRRQIAGVSSTISYLKSLFQQFAQTIMFICEHKYDSDCEKRAPAGSKAKFGVMSENGTPYYSTDEYPWAQLAFNLRHKACPSQTQLTYAQVANVMELAINPPFRAENNYVTKLDNVFGLARPQPTPWSLANAAFGVYKRLYQIIKPVILRKLEELEKELDDLQGRKDDETQNHARNSIKRDMYDFGYRLTQLNNLYELLEHLVVNPRYADWLGQKYAYIRVDVDRNKSALDFYLQRLDAKESFAKLRNRFFGAKWILTSATLSIGRDCSRFTNTLGIKDADVGIVASPFRHQKSTYFYVHGKHPESLSASRAESAKIAQIIFANQGRCLWLCTSNKRVNEVVDQVSHELQKLVAYEVEQACNNLGVKPNKAQMTEIIEKMNFQVLAQSKDTTHKYLIDQLQNAPRTVVVATRSFWEGVDIKGDKLSLLILDKYPNPHPGAYYQTLKELYSDYKNYYYEQFYGADAYITFKQGIGRLIRSEDDYGLIVLLDKVNDYLRHKMPLDYDNYHLDLQGNLNQAVNFLQQQSEKFAQNNPEQESAKDKLVALIKSVTKKNGFSI
ncbi:helicase C-terminal domain-containing protein [Psittacicella hinzii]|uniref:Helicase ATP-binding domain-containing protein n=1 Tax=Psittacicella hinzii TaxID=2028575 RepID=A0A3A1YNN7_9GAMM|nr:helicase C-terminal domain-containing protein [Psittacicella hinzii]RIY39171.1 hypothetical protein CKF58_02715 [Psittacicella hinzii]